MYLILKHVKYEGSLEDDFYIVGSAEDIKNANKLLNAHNTINKKDIFEFWYNFKVFCMDINNRFSGFYMDYF